MRRSMVVMGAGAAMLAGAVAYWRRHPRTGSATMNRVVNRALLEHGVVDRTRGEIGLIEHVGRSSGTVRLTPVHPVRTDTGFRIIVPLGVDSQWARNVVAAGHCRLQVGETVYDLDEPVLLEPTLVDGLPAFTSRLMESLGFRYLVLHRFAERTGRLAATAEPASSPEVEPATVATA